MSENQIRNRVKAVLGGMGGDGSQPTDDETADSLVLPGGPMHPDHALQVLTLAQRTAEEHIAIANRQADKIRNDAQAAADQSARDAQVHAHNVRVEADKALAEARTTTEQAARDARLRADEAQRNADLVLSEAKAEAGSIVGDAQGHAEQLRMRAQQRYDDSVGSLLSKREALQQQIEALEDFDRDYRSRLTSFMQGQLRALWLDQPQVTIDLDLGTIAQESPEEPAEPATEDDDEDEEDEKSAGTGKR